MGFWRSHPICVESASSFRVSWYVQRFVFSGMWLLLGCVGAEVGGGGFYDCFVEFCVLLVFGAFVDALLDAVGLHA